MERYRRLCVGLLLVVSAVGIVPTTAAGTTSTHCEFPVTMTDATGTEITIEERPERVTTTNPSAAQTMWEIGGRDQVVGLTQYASYLDGADQRTNVSASFGVDVEKVVGTNPDLVIAPNASAGDVQALRDAGLTVYHLQAATDIDDIRQKTTTIGRLTGNCRGAEEANTWMDANVGAIQGLTADIEDRPRILYPLGSGFVAANNTFIDALFDIAGADNVAARDHTGYPQLSNEVLLQLDPEVIVVTRDPSIITQEPYASTTAGRNNATVALLTRNLNQPAPRSVVNTAHNLTEQLYPERYSSDTYVPRSAVQSTPTATESQPITATPTPQVTTATDTDVSTTSGSGPGFTAVTALVAVLASALLARRR
ncbi:PGF-CTERM-anchored ABC transporter substrate-binding protein [Haloarcula halophila]|uniref:PGF-CTERM-anchored ABC transporter substrate-binding protein n=1 Tax=Haloarcula TaxID=2237 RepID=UPI0023E3DE4B|nr:PGF-CTERM-anchored ABC transporter substrate-binding protein [Halomicroarcula sp. DFY41]